MTGILAKATIPAVDQGLLAVVTVVMGGAALLLLIVTKGRLGQSAEGPPSGPRILNRKPGEQL